MKAITKFLAGGVAIAALASAAPAAAQYFPGYGAPYGNAYPGYGYPGNGYGYGAGGGSTATAAMATTCRAEARSPPTSAARLFSSVSAVTAAMVTATDLRAAESLGSTASRSVRAVDTGCGELPRPTAMGMAAEPSGSAVAPIRAVTWSISTSTIASTETEITETEITETEITETSYYGSNYDDPYSAYGYHRY